MRLRRFDRACAAAPGRAMSRLGLIWGSRFDTASAARYSRAFGPNLFFGLRSTTSNSRALAASETGFVSFTVPAPRSGPCLVRALPDPKKPF